MENNTKEILNFIEHIVEDDLKSGKNSSRIHTRFPPEPNGYLHIGHAKSICLTFGVAADYKGKCNLRFDDTNPSKESIEYVNAIKKDVEWLGFKWNDLLFTSDYFDKLHGYAVELIKLGKAFVDDSTAEEAAALKGTPTKAGTNSPFRNRSVAENLELFEGMKNGKFAEGSKVLRAKIDMSSPNMHLRDPFIYRIKKVNHHRTGDKWCIYPMYDFAHGISDAIEKITHSLCTLEFEVHRPLYDWFLETLPFEEPPRQIEFARLNLNYTVLSKRKLLQLVEEGLVESWDDPRMPTISGFRRRGYTPESIRTFCDKVGVAKRDGIVDIALLEHSIREDLNKKAPRYMGVLKPLKVVITNYPEGKTEEVEANNGLADEELKTRKMPFSREIYIEQDDFMENPVRKYFRLAPDKVVRLKHAYIIKCEEVIKNDAGEITEVRCIYYPDSKSGEDTSGIKVKGTLHWISAPHALEAEIRIYDRLFSVENPDNQEKDFKEYINPDSLTVLKSYLEPHFKTIKTGENFQLIRKGYFCLDTKDSKKGALVLNQTIALRDNWAKKNKK
jgi:glutaminyl-tRNA synthetase